MGKNLFLLLGRHRLVRGLGHGQALATLALDDFLVLDPGVVDRAEEDESDRGSAAATYHINLVSALLYKNGEERLGKGRGILT